MMSYCPAGGIIANLLEENMAEVNMRKKYIYICVCVYIYVRLGQ